MFLNFLEDVFREFSDDHWMIWNDEEFTYGSLRQGLLQWSDILRENDVRAGDVVALTGDFSPNSVPAFLALLELSCVIVPMTDSIAAKRDEFLRVCAANISINLSGSDSYEFAQLGDRPNHEHYLTLRERNHPGLVLFSSGSTGESKAAVHDLVPMLDKFRVRKRRMRTIAFLLFDHIGGINTMLYTLSNGGMIVVVPDRSPDSVLGAIERRSVELLPTSPTFLNLVLISEAFSRYDLSSLRTVTYGTEPMPESTLKRFTEVVPGVRMQQTYGLSELGILRSKSRDSNSTWVKIGGEGFDTRVLDGILQIKAASAMLGYLNAESPFTDDGWFNTGDLVTVDGEYMQIHGRQSELINVGGEKVHPNEVESVIQELPSVAEVTVYGERNPIVGNMVCAVVRKATDVADAELARDIKRYSAARLDSFKVPVKISFATEDQYSARYKKQRSGRSDTLTS
ncbi:MAG: long-chain fatty acid--CoA ligase [Chloroflexi bacterium]|nr:long-chain fatty acid--CoA ligase [Chloroflexota bacterium]